MYYYAFQSAAASKITVTATATGLYSLINTAGSTSSVRAGFPSDTNAIDITVEDGDVRMLWEGSTPTSTNGVLLSSGNTYYFRGAPLENMKLIRVSGDVICSVMLGKSDRAEATSASAYNVTLEASSVEIGDIDVAKVGGVAVLLDGATYTPGVNYLIPGGIEIDDPTALVTETEGKISNMKGDLSGRLITTAGTLSAGEDIPNNVLQVIQKPFAGVTYSFSRFINFGANATLNVKATSGNVMSLSCHNLNAASRYLQLHNTATTPAPGASPLLTFLVPAGTQIVIGNDFFGMNGLNFSTGIAFAFSTVEATYTAGAAADQYTQLTYA